MIIPTSDNPNCIMCFSKSLRIMPNIASRKITPKIKIKVTAIIARISIPPIVSNLAITSEQNSNKIQMDYRKAETLCQSIKRRTFKSVKYTLGWRSCKLTSITKLCQKSLRLKWWGSLVKTRLAWLLVIEYEYAAKKDFGKFYTQGVLGISGTGGWSVV